MKFLLDENADRRLVPFLTHLNHNILVIGEDYPASILDDEVLAIAVKEKRIIITNDTGDFGELIFRYHHSHNGVILLRMKSEEGNITLMQKRLQYVFSKYADQLHNFLVVTPEKVKVRESVEEEERAA
jgi:predicted nuclease of predicted toxin-antitoxin system